MEYTYITTYGTLEKSISETGHRSCRFRFVVACVSVLVTSSIFLALIRKENYELKSLNLSQDSILDTQLKFYLSRENKLYTQIGNGPPSQLLCPLYDDDTYYPQIPGTSATNPMTDCEAQEDANGICDACKNSEVCMSLCGDAVGNCDDNVQASSPEYVIVCLWEHAASLPDTCAHNLTIHPLFSSNNAPPQVPLARIQELDFFAWNCFFHGICVACADLSTNSTLNEYCLAALLYAQPFYPYNYGLPLIPDETFDGLCAPSVLESIQNGSFFEPYIASSM